MSDKKKVALKPMSPSRLKTLSSCSWTYFCKYILKLPDKTNSGSSMGTIVHDILEDLFKENNTKRIAAIKKKGSLADKDLNFRVEKAAVEAGIGEFREQIHPMIDRAINHDFFGDKHKKPKAVYSELDFDITKETEDGSFRILGFIDQLFIYEDGTAIVRDFKTSKKMFEGKDAEENLQDQIYTYAAKELHGRDLKVSAEFLFLKFDLSNEGTLKMKPISNLEHSALELELIDWQKLINNFGEKDAKRSFAADAPFPKDGSFTGPLMCGFAKEKGQLKKDGTPMFACAFKWSFNFWALVDKDGNTIKSAYEKDKDKLVADPKKGETIKKMKYAGCPKFNS